MDRKKYDEKKADWERRIRLEPDPDKKAAFEDQYADWLLDLMEPGSV